MQTASFPREALSPVRVARGWALPFDGGTLAAVRACVAARAEAAGLSVGRREDLVLAVNELATNSVRHGGGRGELRAWEQEGALVCEIRDRGRFAEPLADRARPAPGQVGGFGLWIVHQLCDLVELRSRPDGTVVRVRVRVGGRRLTRYAASPSRTGSARSP